MLERIRVITGLLWLSLRGRNFPEQFIKCQIDFVHRLGQFSSADGPTWISIDIDRNPLFHALILP